MQNAKGGELSPSTGRRPQQLLSTLEKEKFTQPTQDLPFDLPVKMTPKGQAYPLAHGPRSGGIIDLGWKGRKVHGESPIDKIMGERGLTPKEVAMSRLFKSGVDAGSMRVIDMPYEEARKIVLSGPQQMRKEGWLMQEAHPEWPRSDTAKPVTRLHHTGEESASSIHGLALERLKWRSPVTTTELKVADIAAQATKAAGVEAPSMKEAVDLGSQMANLWKRIGGSRGIQGKMWGEALNSSRLKSMFDNPREYMIHSGVKWQKNPRDFETKFPREAKYLKMHWAEHMEGK